MRILLKLEPEMDGSIDLVDKHHVQAFFYSCLKETAFDIIHGMRGFKFFCFSDVMPPSDFVEGQEKYLLFTTPSRAMGKQLIEVLREKNRVKLGPTMWFGLSTKRVPSRPFSPWISASPIVLQKNREGTFLSFERGDTVDLFLERLADNATKKYNAYHGDELVLEEPIFDVMRYDKPILTRLTMKGKNIVIIGSKWKLLHKKRVPPGLKKFYSFIFDCGLGEKNSLGFGCVNEKRVADSGRTRDKPRGAPSR